jgi:uncharacterized membrane protein
VKDVLEVDEFLTRAERDRVRDAVRNAEKRTSGEVRVHLDAAIMEGVLDHAAFVFDDLGMKKTKDRNGVLLYVSVPSRKVAVIGDAGIHAKSGQHYWDSVLELVLSHFREGRYSDGLCAGVQRIGEQLREHFPYERDDMNELDDDVSLGR